MQKDEVYVMDVDGVNKVCNGTFTESKVFTKVPAKYNNIMLLYIWLAI